MASNKVWYVIIERDANSGIPKESRFLFFGPFTKGQAEWAIQDDPDIDGECAENSVDCIMIRYRDIPVEFLSNAMVCNPISDWKKGWTLEGTLWIPYTFERKVTKRKDLLPLAD